MYLTPILNHPPPRQTGNKAWATDRARHSDADPQTNPLGRLHYHYLAVSGTMLYQPQL